MAIVDLKVHDNLTGELKQLLKRSRDLSPVMARVESGIMARQRRRGWMYSGLHRRTGFLYRSTKTWHGKTSAGVSGEASGATMATPIGFALTMGREKAAGDRRGRNRKHWVRAYRRRGRRVRRHRRYMPTPWGDIPARPYIEETMDPADKARIGKWVIEFLDKDKR